MTRAPLAALALAALVACVTPPPAESPGPIDWEALAGERVPVIVTIDADGDLRETRLWLVVVDGGGFIRTGDTRWFRNLELDPEALLRIRDRAYRVRAEQVIDAALRGRVMHAFRDKYGWQDRLLGWFGSPSDANILRLGSRTDE